MATPAHPRPSFRFGEFELDAANGELRKAGISLKLHPQPFQVLILLLQHPGQLVSRDEIRSCLWGGNTFVDFERGINSCVNQIRVTLRDDSEKPRYIETVPRRGYRFIASVSTQLPPAQVASPDAHAPDLQVVPSKSHETALALRKLRILPLIVSASVTLAVGLAIYLWISGGTPRELRETQLTANSSDNPVTGDAISPDGEYLAYSDKKGVHIKLLATGETQTLSQTSSDWYFAWFPDSTRFLGSEISRPGLWSFSLIGGAPSKLLEDGTLGSVSPDGSLVAFTRNTGRVGDREMWLIGSDGSNLRKILEVAEDAAVQNPEWSPDGKRVAYYIQRQFPDKLEATVEIRDLNGGPLIDVYSEAAPTLERTKLRDFQWLPGGSIIFSLAEPDSDLVNSFSIRCNLWELRLDSSTGLPSKALRRLTNWPGGADVVLPYVTSDGKRLSVLKMTASVSVYLGDFDAEGKHISSPRRLTATDGWNNAPVWDRNSRAIFFESNRDGRLRVFRQDISRETAEPVATGSGEASVPVVSPDGAFLLYVTPAHSMAGGSLAPAQLMRVPIGGGPPEQVLSAHIFDSPRCSKAPASLCAIAEPAQDRKQMIFTAFDPLKGRGRELARIEADPDSDYAWDLSPDGAKIAFVRRVPRSDGKIFLSRGPIHVLSLNGVLPRQINVKGIDIFREYVDWAADSKGLILAHPTDTGSEVLLVNLHGTVSVLWRHQDADPLRGVPSPDGRHLAILCGGQYNNVWMMENF